MCKWALNLEFTQFGPNFFWPIRKLRVVFLSGFDIFSLLYKISATIVKAYNVTYADLKYHINIKKQWSFLREKPVLLWDANTWLFPLTVVKATYLGYFKF
jgi:hypothetical protein